MVTVYNCKHLRWDNNISINHYELFADTDSELPTSDSDIEAIIGSGYKMAQGSIAWVIATGKAYMLDSTNSWVLQGT